MCEIVLLTFKDVSNEQHVIHIKILMNVSSLTFV